jgi:hypothetical protein
MRNGREEEVTLWEQSSSRGQKARPGIRDDFQMVLEEWQSPTKVGNDHVAALRKLDGARVGLEEVNPIRDTVLARELTSKLERIRDLDRKRSPSTEPARHDREDACPRADVDHHRFWPDDFLQRACVRPHPRVVVQHSGVVRQRIHFTRS